VDEITSIDRIPVTSPFRTLLDMAAVLPERQLEKILNEVEAQQLTDGLSMHELLRRHPRRRGSAVLRRLLAELDAGSGTTRSELEDRFVALLDRSRLPRPQLNASISANGRFFEADCLWAEQRLIVELDGRAVHGTRRAFERDRERDRCLLADGWRVVRVTWRQLENDASAVLADLRSLLRE
jgi:very-short-patch-repair endonuclease